MGTACLDYFGIRLECLATFPSDRLLVRSVAERQPIVDLFPQSRFAVAVKGVAERLALPTWSTA
jgi:MinD-like ATPase involved in chromosome partitioning or flagellar assembly